MFDEHPEYCQKLHEKYPSIPWDEPVPLNGMGVSTQYGCRYCIAIYGLPHAWIRKHPQTKDEFVKHLKSEHNIYADPENIG